MVSELHTFAAGSLYFPIVVTRSHSAFGTGSSAVSVVGRIASAKRAVVSRTELDGVRPGSYFEFLGSYERRLCGRRHERRRRAGIVRTFYLPVNGGDDGVEASLGESFLSI